MPAELHAKARRMLARGMLVGMLQGLLQRRRFPPTISGVHREMIEFHRRPPAPVPSKHEMQHSDDPRKTGVQNSPLRICLLSVGYPPASTHGVARSTATLARGLAELGHEVHVVTAGRRLHVTIRDGVRIHEVSGEEHARYSDLATRGYSNLGHWLNHSHAVSEMVGSLEREEGIQLVDSPLWGLEGLVTAVAGALPIAVRVVTSMKQIAEIHGRLNPENSLLGELEGRFLSAADLVISNSGATTRAVTGVYGLDAERLNIGFATYGMVPAAEVLVRPLSDQQPAELRILFVGRLEKRKGVLELFDAIPNVLKEFPGARFLLAGSDNRREDGFFEEHACDYRSHFRRRFPAAAAAVDFLGFVDDKRLEELYRTCDLFVAPSLYESFGLIYLEAMNWARPVIACAAGGPEEIVVAGETGELVPPGDSRSLAESVNRLLESPRLRRDMGVAGRLRLLDRFTHRSMAASFAVLYADMLDGGRLKDPR
jgi:glycosyltransferase involved in cell wall biosynthesis